jgi:hypothetical protein
MGMKMHKTVVDLSTGEVSIFNLTPEEIAEASKPEPVEQVRARRINELKELLSASDYKAMPDYDRTSEDLISQRQMWRKEIRELRGQTNNGT